MATKCIEIDITDIPEDILNEAWRLGVTEVAYKQGLLKPRYPVPAVELDNALAMPNEQITFRLKAILLHYVHNNGFPRRKS